MLDECMDFPSRRKKSCYRFQKTQWVQVFLAGKTRQPGRKEKNNWGNKTRNAECMNFPSHGRKVSGKGGLLLEVAGIQPVLLEKDVKVGTITAGDDRGIADIPLGVFQQAHQIIFFKGVFGLFKRL